MIKLYHCMSARSFRVLWTLEELGMAYQLVMLPFPPRLNAPEFLEKNPAGTVPLLVHGQTRMTESVAICQYVSSLGAQSSQSILQVLPHEAEYGAYLNYLHFGEATLTFPLTLVLRYSRFEPKERQLPSVVEDYSRWFLSRLRTLEPVLCEHDYLCADRFTVADISVGYAVMLAAKLGLDERFKPAIARYWARLQARPAFGQAIKAQQAAALEQGVQPTAATDVLFGRAGQ